MRELDYLHDRCIRGDASEADLRRLQELLQDPVYEAEAGKLLMTAFERPPEDLTDMDAGTRQDILQAILQTDLKPRLRNKIIRWSAAAAVLLLISGGIYYRQLQTQDRSIVQGNGINLAPGSNKAVLTFADGTQIALDSTGNRVIGTGVLQQGAQLQYKKNATASINTLATPRGGQFQLLLPDGTKVWLNAASSIRYPTAFKGKERVVEIMGEVYFEVAQDAAKPFRVKVNNTTIDVLGTSFNIHAYEDEPYMTTTLLDGSIRVGDITLQPGEQLYNGKIVRNADLAKIMAWKNGLFNFEDAKLEDVMRQLSRWYDLKVVYEAGVPDITFWGKMSRNVTLQDVLIALKSTKVNFRLEENRQLIIYSK